MASGRSTPSSRSGSQDTFRRDGRGRSPSPSEYFRNLHQTQNNLEMYEYGLNEFIYNGIQKFLDKQAVRDLIAAYDSDDIFPDGIENFYSNLYENDDYDGNDDRDGQHRSIGNDFSMLVKRAQESQMLKTKPEDFIQNEDDAISFRMDVFSLIARFCGKLLSSIRFQNKVQADGDIIEEIWQRQNSQRNRSEHRQNQTV